MQHCYLVVKQESKYTTRVAQLIRNFREHSAYLRIFLSCPLICQKLKFMAKNPPTPAKLKLLTVLCLMLSGVCLKRREEVTRQKMKQYEVSREHCCQMTVVNGSACVHGLSLICFAVREKPFNTSHASRQCWPVILFLRVSHLSR